MKVTNTTKVEKIKVSLTPTEAANLCQVLGKVHGNADGDFIANLYYALNVIVKKAEPTIYAYVSGGCFHVRDV